MVDNSEFFNTFASRKGASLKHCNTRDDTYCNIIASLLCKNRIGCRSIIKQNVVRTIYKDTSWNFVFKRRDLGNVFVGAVKAY